MPPIPATSRARPTGIRPSLYRLMLALPALLAGFTAVPALAQQPAPLQTVPAVDVNRYMGRWYQIAFYPNDFQKQCTANVTADYKLLYYGQIEVINRCARADGTTDTAQGRARLQQPRLLGIPIGDPVSTARLEVRFAPAILSWLPQVWAPYWVIQLAEDYRYAVVSEPTREYLWILARTPTLPAADLTRIKTQLQAQGFDTGKLVALPPSKL